jgi:putative thioredoxin
VSNVRDVDTAEFNEQVIQRSHEVPVVVDFWAEWCGPCRTLGPTLERLTDEAGGAFELAKVDVDQNQALAGQMGVQGIPTVVAFKDGQPVSRFTGALPEPQVKEWLTGFVPNPMDDFVFAADDLVDQGRDDEAATMYRKVLETDPAHEGAAVGLASLLLAGGDPDGALSVLQPLPGTPDVERIRAAVRLSGGDSAEALTARLAADPDNEELQIELSRSLIAGGEYEAGLDRLLDIVAGKGEQADAARAAMLDAFEVLGPDDPRTGAYRRRLASALF